MYNKFSFPVLIIVLLIKSSVGFSQVKSNAFNLQNPYDLTFSRYVDSVNRSWPLAEWKEALKGDDYTFYLCFKLGPKGIPVEIEFLEAPEMVVPDFVKERLKAILLTTLGKWNAAGPAQGCDLQDVVCMVHILNDQRTIIERVNAGAKFIRYLLSDDVKPGSKLYEYDSRRDKQHIFLHY